MNVIGLQIAPVHQWTENGRLQAEFREPAPQELFKQENVRWQLDMYVSRWQKNLRRLSEGARELENFRAETEAENQLSGLESLSDDQLLDQCDRLAMLAEDALDWRERFDIRISDLQRVRDSVGVWSEDAGKLLAEFHRLRELVVWREQILRKWADQLCEEYLCRHPELPELPFEPLELGPTNSARLPPAL